MKKTIILTGGGTGGHIIPLLSLAHALKKADPGCKIIYVGLKGGEVENRLRSQYKDFDEVRAITSGKFRRYYGESFLAHLIDLKTIFLNIGDFFKVLYGIISANRLLGQVKPDLVFSKGGFVVVPVGIAAKMRKVPIVTHDSDAVPGLANRIIGRFAKMHATGLPASYYDYPKDSLKYVGIPIDPRVKLVNQSDLINFKKQLGLASDSLVLLVAGGGLGAKTINDLILEIAPQLLHANPNLHIINIAGPKHETELKKRYQALLGSDERNRVVVLGFSPEFFKYSAAADLVVARAGANTLAELAVQQKAVVVIPSPFLTGGHQLKNAQELATKGAAKVLSNDITGEEMFVVVDHLLKNDNQRQVLAKKLGELAKPGAAAELAKLLLEEIEEQKGR